MKRKDTHPQASASAQEIACLSVFPAVVRASAGQV
jgi:hypothetical protein